MVLNVSPGQTVFVDVTITNNGTSSGIGYLRCSLVPSGQTIGIDLIDVISGSKDISVNLNVGASATIIFKTPAGGMPFTPTGSWGTDVIGRTQPNLAGTVLDEVFEANQVSLVGVFDLQITNILEHL